MKHAIEQYLDPLEYTAVLLVDLRLLSVRSLLRELLTDADSPPTPAIATHIAGNGVVKSAADFAPLTFPAASSAFADLLSDLIELGCRIQAHVRGPRRKGELRWHLPVVLSADGRLRSSCVIRGTHKMLLTSSAVNKREKTVTIGNVGEIEVMKRCPPKLGRKKWASTARSSSYKDGHQQTI